MRPREGRRRGGIRGPARGLLAVLAVLACASPEPVSPLPPERGDVCEDLAYVFFLVARQRERGESRDTQLARLRESVQNPFTTRPELALRNLAEVVDRVYDSPHRNARELEASVLDDCSVDERGQAVLSSRKAD